MFDNSTISLVGGAGLIVVWLVVVFGLRLDSRYFNLLLGVGVTVLIRGIALSRWGTPPAR